MNRQEQNRLASESIKRAVESIDNGIVIEYHDHLSMDSFRLYIRKDGKAIAPDTHYMCDWSAEKKGYVIDECKVENHEADPDGMEVNMLGDSGYYRSCGLGTYLKKYAEKYRLPVYLLNIGWFTFPMKYGYADSYLEPIQKYAPEARLYTCDLTLTEVKG